MPLPDPMEVAKELPPSMRPVIAPLHRHAFGLAIGVTGAVILGGFAAACATVEGEGDAELFVWLMGTNFLPGYRPTWPGALAGLWWGFFGGYIAGWIFAFARNSAIRVWAWYVGTRQRLRQSSNVLDDLS